MPSILFANNAASALAAPITDADLSLAVTAGHGARFPSPTSGNYFYATLIGLDGDGVESTWEVVKVTGRSGDTLTIERAQDSTVAAAWDGGTRLEMRNNAAIFAGLLQGNQAITLSGDASGTGTTAITVTLATVTPAKGGTGLTSYAVGDLLYASGATTLAKLADVATGSALISGGVNTAPSWGKIGLATHVSGTLPVANGGTGAATLTGLLKGNGTGAFTAAAAGTDYVSPTGTETLTGKTITTVSLKQAKVAIAASAIDLATGNLFSKTITATTTFTVSNAPTTGTSVCFLLDLTNGGSQTINWWTGMKWAAGTAPTLTAAGRDVLGFFTHDGGTTWTGLVLGLDVK